MFPKACGEPPPGRVRHGWNQARSEDTSRRFSRRCRCLTQADHLHNAPLFEFRRPGNSSFIWSEKLPPSPIPKLYKDKSSCRFTVCPTGDTFGGPCQQVRTPKNSQQCATFRARLRPPAAEICMRMKSIHRFATNGSHSFWLTNSSPMAIGVLDCSRTLWYHALSSGANRSSMKKGRYCSTAFARVSAPAGVGRSWTSWHNSTSQPTVFLR